MSAVSPKLARGAVSGSAWREQWMQRWAAFAPRERQAITLAAWALAVLLVWLIAVQPALRTLRVTPAQIDALDAQLQFMQALATETTGLRAATPVSTAQATAALTAATERMGGRGRLTVQGDRAILTLNGADTESLRAWLELARSAARARPVEAQWSRGPNGYSGTLVVAFGALR